MKNTYQIKKGHSKMSKKRKHKSNSVKTTTTKTQETEKPESTTKDSKKDSEETKTIAEQVLEETMEQKPDTQDKEEDSITTTESSDNKEEKAESKKPELTPEEEAEQVAKIIEASNKEYKDMGGGMKAQQVAKLVAIVGCMIALCLIAGTIVQTNKTIEERGDSGDQFTITLDEDEILNEYNNLISSK